MFNSTLSIGSKGENVNKLNSILKSLQYNVSELSEDFDNKTLIAVEAFQNDFGINIDGIVNEITWSTLIKASGYEAKLEEVEIEVEEVEEEATVSNEIIVEEKKEEINIQSEDNVVDEVEVLEYMPLLKPGDNGDNVKILQEELKLIGYFDAKPNGIYGKITFDAVKKFQKDNGVEADGIVGPITWDLLDLELDKYGY